MKEFEKRLGKLESLSGLCDVVVIANTDYKDPNFLYFTGCSPSYSFFIYDFCEPVVVTNKMEIRSVESDIKIDAEITTDASVIRKLRGKKIGVNGRFVPFGVLKRFRRTDISSKLLEIRSIKSDYEIKRIKRASTAVMNVLDSMDIRPGMKTGKIITEIKRAILQEDCEPVEVIVAADGYSSFPHGSMKNRKIKKIAVVDVVSSFDGYHADFTRTFVFDKTLEKKSIELFDVLKNAEKALKPGMETKTLDSFVRKHIGDFPHSLGHGIGLETHEYPPIGPKSRGTFERNQVFTLEPAFYGKYGFRIENTYVMKNKPRVLGI
ncbi:MAG: aminopeptidase P family protein [Candidatus Micrarchaeota archaeon]|nr:aminopeptidase P family protein [Candidatus Micrarchaeota archaeon]